MKFRGILFDVGGIFHVPQDDPRRENAFINKTPRILEQAGIVLSPAAGTAVETLREIIRAGEAEYRNYAVASRRELPPERIWTEYFLKALGFHRSGLHTPWRKNSAACTKNAGGLSPAPPSGVPSSACTKWACARGS